jgi:hypothetical protein
MMAAASRPAAAVLDEWAVPELCESCGQLHGGCCRSPVTEPPPGLVGDDGELTPLGAVVEEAANCLCVGHSYLDPDAGQWPSWVLAQLAALWQEGPCDECPVWGPHALADHFMGRKRREYERALPAWTCDCGAVFKLLGWGGRREFYRLGDDGMLGDEAGGIHLDSKGRIQHSDSCPGCGRPFAETVSRQTKTAMKLADAPAGTSPAPQQTLF